MIWRKRRNDNTPANHTALTANASYKETFGPVASACLTARRHEEAVRWARKSLQQQPNYTVGLLIFASALGHLGQEEQARETLEKALRLRPAFAKADGYPFRFKHPEDRDHIFDGLRKAGWEG